MARGFVGAGVLSALEEAHIPVAAVYGTEIGALIGALYGMSASVDAFEWTLMKIRDEAFLGKSSFLPLFKRLNDGKPLEEALAAIFTGRDLAQARLPVRLALLPEGASDSEVIASGDAAVAVRSAMAVPGLLTAGRWRQSTAVAATSVRPYLVAEAKTQGGPVVVVDALNGAMPKSESMQEQLFESQMIAVRKMSAAELKTADFVISPDLSWVGFFDFKKRSELVYRGRTAVKAVLSELRALTGGAR
jgi:predicted acylesterase/phospholipase RssA